MTRYTVHDFQKDFPNEETCLEWLVNYRWPNGIHCKQCNRVTNHHYIESRKSYSCQICGHHVHPTADTIFHKSSTPLQLWFYTIYLLGQTGDSITVNQVEQEIGVTYKTAWRMCKLIRNCLHENESHRDNNSHTEKHVKSYL